MSTPRVTVVMVLYNAQRFLRSAIDSVLAQTYGDWELLLIDDGSTDESSSIIQSYRDARLRLIRNPTNEGVRRCRRRALEMARGEYVAVLDADDVAATDRLRSQAGFLESHVDTLLVGSAVQEINDEGRAIRTILVPTDPLTIRWRLLFGNCIAHSAAMFRRDAALESGGYDEQVLCGEDYDLWVRLAARGTIAQLNQPLARWRRHPGSLYHTEPPQMKDHVVRTVIKSLGTLAGQRVEFNVARALWRDDPNPPPINPEVAREALTTIVNCLASFAQTTGQHRELTRLALEEIRRFSRRHRGNGRIALATAWRCATQHDWSSVISAPFVKLAGEILAPRSTS